MAFNNITINRFIDEYHFLDNFYPCNINYCGIVFPSSEHLFQARKSKDEKIWRIAAAIPKAGKAKAFGRTINLRSDWEEVKVNIMISVVYLKFSQNIDIMMKLRELKGIHLCEGNYHHDNFWGDCYCDNCKNITGQNKLGYCLEKVMGNMFL